MTTYFNHLCDNCKAWLEPTDPVLCSPCVWLLKNGGKVRSNGETEKFVNRRWQHRFNRGELPDLHFDAGVLWERKQKDQDW